MKKVAKIDWTAPPAPDDLSDEAVKLYEFYVGGKIIIKAPAQITAFVEGLRSLDRAAEARRILKAEGLTAISKRSGLAKRHPAVDVLENAEINFRKIFKKLNILRNDIYDGFHYNDIC